MLVVAAVLAILALLCFAFSNSCNGGGPERGCLGAMVFLPGLAFTFAAIVVFAFWLGTRM